MRAMISFVLVTLFSVGMSASAAEPADAVLGKWLTDGGKSQVEIYKGKADDGEEKYYGKLVWFKDPVYAEDDPEAGKTVHDRKNPDPKRHDDPLLGLIMLRAFVHDSENGEWNSGTIYDPEVGKVYKCTIKIVDDPAANGGKKLDVHGYVGVPMFGRSTIWTRPGDEAPASPPAESK